MVKDLPAGPEAKGRWVGPQDREGPLEEGLVTQSSVLAWRIPWTEEPGRYSPQGCSGSDTTEPT